MICDSDLSLHGVKENNKSNTNNDNNATENYKPATIYDFLAVGFIVLMFVICIISLAIFTNQRILDQNDRDIYERIGKIETILRSIVS